MSLTRSHYHRQTTQESVGEYIDKVIKATRPCSQRETYCRDECECQIQASIAVAANSSTVTYLKDTCCGDPGDCNCDEDRR